jgi:hypothetical protein
MGFNLSWVGGLGRQKLFQRICILPVASSFLHMCLWSRATCARSSFRWIPQKNWIPQKKQELLGWPRLNVALGEAVSNSSRIRAGQEIP